MPDRLPPTKSEWKQAAKRTAIDHTQSLASGNAFVSGSKFEFEHFLRLRVLYIQEQIPRNLPQFPGFPYERLKEMDKIIERHADFAFLKSFLQNKEKIGSHWDVKSAREAGMFAVALEHLHLIAKRGVKNMKDGEDTSDLKLILSPQNKRQTQSTTQFGNHNQLSLSIRHPYITPTRGSSQSHHEPEPPPSPNESNIDTEFTNLSLDSPGEVFSQPNTDLRGAMDKFERSNFSPGDEQTVNAALVALMTALSWSLGYTGRVHHDRASFSISKDAKTDLYTACVDGLIMHLDRDRCNGFMEAKRDYRGGNQAVRRQIAAQMAAFIFEQDVVLAKETEETTEKVTERVTRQATKAKAKSKKDESQDRDSGNQEQ